MDGRPLTFMAGLLIKFTDTLQLEERESGGRDDDDGRNGMRLTNFFVHLPMSNMIINII